MSDGYSNILPSSVMAHLVIGDQFHEGVCAPSGGALSPSEHQAVCFFPTLEKTSLLAFNLDGIGTAKPVLTYLSGASEARLPSRCLVARLQADVTVELKLKNTTDDCGLPLLARHYREMTSEKVRGMAFKANREMARGRFRFDLERDENKLELLAQERPHFFQLVDYVAEATGVPAEILHAVMDHESHYSLKTVAGLGQFDSRTWNSISSSPLFLELYQHAFTNKEIPKRGQDSFADVLAIAAYALFTASHFGMQPELSEKFFVTMEAVHSRGQGGARRIVRDVMHGRLDRVPAGFKRMYRFVQKLHTVYQRIQHRSDPQPIS